jgi:ElaB/YqjD/DUF883 family membrane-anchored ribosome-binding protein
MDKQTQANSGEMGTLAEDARALMAATAAVPGERISEARNRLAAALDSGRKIFGRAKEKAVEGAKATDQALREHPYPALALAFGIGTIVGYILVRRCSRDGH